MKKNTATTRSGSEVTKELYVTSLASCGGEVEFSLSMLLLSLRLFLIMSPSRGARFHTTKRRVLRRYAGSEPLQSSSACCRPSCSTLSENVSFITKGMDCTLDFYYSNYDCKVPRRGPRAAGAAHTLGTHSGARARRRHTMVHSGPLGKLFAESIRLSRFESADCMVFLPRA